jgi:hypothetical protein
MGDNHMNPTTLLILQAFFGQCLFVFLLGTQTANIRDNDKRAAFFTSILIAVPEVTVLSSIVRSAQTSGNIVVYIAFALGGALGIVLSMLLSDYRNKKK